MRRIIAGIALVIAGFQISGCEADNAEVVESSPSPDGKNMIWVTFENHGINSSTTEVRITKSGEKPVRNNSVMITSYCSGATVSWVNNDTVLIEYDDFYGLFGSSLPNSDVKVILMDRKYSNHAGGHQSIEVSCEHALTR